MSGSRRDEQRTEPGWMPNEVRTESAGALGAVLKPGPAMVVVTLLALFAIGAVGWKLRDSVTRAEAAERSGGSVDAEEWALMRKDIGEIKSDVLKLKCRWNIDNVCPAESPVRSSGFGR